MSHTEIQVHVCLQRCGQNTYVCLRWPQTFVCSVSTENSIAKTGSRHHHYQLLPIPSRRRRRGRANPITIFPFPRWIDKRRALAKTRFPMVGRSLLLVLLTLEETEQNRRDGDDTPWSLTINGETVTDYRSGRHNVGKLGLFGRFTIQTSWLAGKLFTLVCVFFFCSMLSEVSCF